MKLRLRRRVKQSREQAMGLGDQAGQSFERYVLKRLDRLKRVRRFVFAWTALLFFLAAGVVLQSFNLSSYYQTVQAIPGGTYREGILGTFSTANPLYATGDVNNTVTKLLFSGLFNYDQTNTLAGDLAQGYDVSANGRTYTVKLKPNLSWHDGRPLTSADVLYTYQSIQNPDAQSPLTNSWQGIEIAAPDADTVSFTLPSQLASFPNTMTNGIVPKHILEKIPAAELRTADFNTINPIGSGPFKWQSIKVSGSDPNDAQEQIALLPFEKYHRGAPKLERFVVNAYADRDQLLADFEEGGLTGLAGLSSVPDQLKTKADLQINNFLLTAGTYTFFKTTHPILMSQKVRQALVLAADPKAIIEQLPYPTKPVTGPFLQGQLGYDPALAQPKTDLAAAKAALDADGWVIGANGIRTKDKKPLAFSLAATNTSESKMVTGELKKQWRALGVDLSVRLFSSQDFQNTLAYHEYDAVLYGISIGVDPDVFVYWDSSQVDIRSANRLNLSEYKNKVADAALESGRTRLDPTLRTVKYRPFLVSWQQDLPALGLYQPRVLYITNGPVAGLEERVVNDTTDRLENVHNWMIREARVTNDRSGQ